MDGIFHHSQGQKAMLLYHWLRLSSVRRSVPLHFTDGLSSITKRKTFAKAVSRINKKWMANLQ